MNATLTSTIQVRKAISVMAYSCDSKTSIITLTISNRGNTRIEEDEIKIYINDEYKGTFGKAIEPGTLSKNSVQGSPGQNIVKIVAPSNSVRIVFWC
jgi:archaellum component FlaF (FlaF/FlaG flagellin family)